MLGLFLEYGRRRRFYCMRRNLLPVRKSERTYWVELAAGTLQNSEEELLTNY